MDVSVAGIPEVVALKILTAINKALNVHYDVTLEYGKTHIHVEFQPRGKHYLA